MIRATTTMHHQRKDAMGREYITQHVPGTFLPFEQRQTLAADWNGLARAGRRITVRQFAARHGLRPETCRHEYHQGATGVAAQNPRDRQRRRYAEYDPFRAYDAINEGNANKDTRMAVTNQMAALFRRHVIKEKLSPHDIICHMKKELLGQRIPCLSTWHRHINTKDVGIRYGHMF